MGGFINSQSDAEICEVLNRRFSDDVNANGDTFLEELRAFFSNKEKLFNNNHKLNRVFHRLAIGVTGGASVPKTKRSRLRWFYLLKGNLPAAVDKAIRLQLTAILDTASPSNPAGGVDYVTFSTIHQSTKSGDQFELIDNSNPPNVNQDEPTPASDANGKSYCALILRCNVDQGLPDAPGEDDPPKSDGGNVEKGAIPYSKPKPINPFSKPKPIKKPPKKLSKKSPKKKSKKKTGKKVSKTAPE